VRNRRARSLSELGATGIYHLSSSQSPTGWASATAIHTVGMHSLNLTALWTPPLPPPMRVLVITITDVSAHKIRHRFLLMIWCCVCATVRRRFLSIYWDEFETNSITFYGDALRWFNDRIVLSLCAGCKVRDYGERDVEPSNLHPLRGHFTQKPDVHHAINLFLKVAEAADKVLIMLSNLSMLY
jgi:hypothetical protein